MSTIHFIEGSFGMTQFYACVLIHLLMQTQPIAIFRVKGAKGKEDFPLQNLYPNTRVITTTYITREFDQIWDVANSGTSVVVYLEAKSGNRFWQWLEQSMATQISAGNQPVSFVHWLDYSLLPTHQSRSTRVTSYERSGYEFFNSFTKHVFQFKTQVKHILIGTDEDWHYLRFQTEYYIQHRLRKDDSAKQKMLDSFNQVMKHPSVSCLDTYRMSRLEYDSLNWETQRFSAVLEGFATRSQTASLLEHRQVQTILKVQQAFQSSKGFQAIANPHTQNDLWKDKVHPVKALPASHDSIKEQPLVLNGASA